MQKRKNTAQKKPEKLRALSAVFSRPSAKQKTNTTTSQAATSKKEGQKSRFAVRGFAASRQYRQEPPEGP
jgi:hypothetical protein